MYTGINKIAIGSGNIVGLRAWDKLSPPLFRGFAFVNVEYKDPEERMNANRRFVDFGKPATTLVFELLEDCEIKYIMETFFGGGANADRLVTIKAENRNTRKWGYYNATMKRPRIGVSMTDTNSGLTEVKIELIDILVIP